MVLMPEQKNMLLKPKQKKSHFVDARFVTRIFWNCNINLSNLMLVFVDIVDMKSNQAEVWPRIQSFFEAHNALSPLCLWQCLFAYLFRIVFVCMCFCIGNIEALVFWHKEHKNNEFRIVCPKNIYHLPFIKTTFVLYSQNVSLSHLT